MDVLLLRQEPTAPGHDPSSTPDDCLDRGDGGHRIVCRACGHEITRSDARMAVNGSHHHVFSNPAGYVFEIGCFRSAPGCVHTGPPSTEFTWFPGHSWQVALCGGCGQLLGWRYRDAKSRAGGFHGLILPHLDEIPDED